MLHPTNPAGYKLWSYVPSARDELSLKLAWCAANKAVVSCAIIT